MGSGAVSWSAKKKTTTADLSTEAEYVFASSAGQEMLWMRNLVTKVGINVSRPSALLVDNQSALRVLKNPEHHGRMKHPTDDMLAEIFTKPLPCPIYLIVALGAK